MFRAHANVVPFTPLAVHTACTGGDKAQDRHDTDKPDHSKDGVQGLSPIQESKAGDIWAVGVLLFTMLTHRDPFDNAAAASREPRTLPTSNMAAQYTWPSQCTPSAQCQDLVAQMLEADPVRRITAEQVMRHPWYLCDLPRELQVPLSLIHI